MDSEGLNTTTTGGHEKRPTKIRFEYDDEEQQQQRPDQDETLTESSNLEVEEDTAMCDPSADDDSMAGDDKTSADYYFDSYSHFGNFPLLAIPFSYIFLGIKITKVINFFLLIYVFFGEEEMRKYNQIDFKIYRFVL